MKIRLMMIAALAALTFASCSKDDNGENNNVNGGKAKMSVSFTLPTDAMTRTQSATDKESTVTTVDLFIFDNTGAVASVGGYASFDIATDFTQGGSNKYTLTDAHETVAGSGTIIYVGLNLPSGLQKSFPNQAALLREVEEVSNMIGDDAFVMFSDKETANLLPSDHEDLEDEDGVNTVTMSIGRVASKVTASYATAGINKTWTYGEGGDAVTIDFKYTITAFNVYQEAHTSFVAENAKTLINNYTKTDWDEVINLYAVSVLKDNVDMDEHPADDDERVGMDCFYVGENNPVTAQNGNTTYAMIATTLELNKAAKWDDTKEAVVYEDATYGAGDSDIYVIKHMGVNYVTNSKTKVDAISAGLKDAYNETDATAKYYHYRDGYVHFQVWLNRVGDNDYRVGRNEFIHVKVQDIKDLNETFPGYPGKEGETDKPIDPTEEGGNNPDPIDPIDPVDPENALLKVEITVKPWTYKPNEVELS